MLDQDGDDEDHARTPGSRAALGTTCAVSPSPTIVRVVGMPADPSMSPIRSPCHARRSTRWRYRPNPVSGSASLF